MVTETLKWQDAHVSGSFMQNKIYVRASIQNKSGSYSYYICEMDDESFHLGLVTFANSVDVPKPNTNHSTLDMAKSCAKEHLQLYFKDQPNLI